MTIPTSSPDLPSGHAVEIVRPGSTFLGQFDYSTRQPLRVGDMVVVCHRAATPGVVTVEAWRESVPQCPYCQADNPGFSLPPPPPTPNKKPIIPPDKRREPQPQRKSILPWAIIAGFLLLIAAFVFMALGGSGGGTAPTPAGRATPNELVVVVPTEPPPTRTPALRPTATLQPAQPTPLPPTTSTPAQRMPDPTPRRASPISQVLLYDAGRDQALLALSDGGTIDLSQLGTARLNVVAETTTPVGSIKFLLDGNEFCKNSRCVENAPPYSMAGDVDGDYYDNWDWSELLGSHTIQVIPYSGANAGGEQLPGVMFRFTVVP